MTSPDLGAAKAGARAGLDQVIAALGHLVTEHGATEDEIAQFLLLSTLASPDGTLGLVGVAALSISDLIRCQIENANLTERVAELEARPIR